jgi:hypothetical protein
VILPSSTSQAAGMTDIHHHTQRNISILVRGPQCTWAHVSCVYPQEWNHCLQGLHVFNFLGSTQLFLRPVTSVHANHQAFASPNPYILLLSDFIFLANLIGSGGISQRVSGFACLIWCWGWNPQSHACCTQVQPPSCS